jgi:hypothetical protein
MSTICLPTLEEIDSLISKHIWEQKNYPPNVPLLNQHTSMMNTLGKTTFEYLGL